VGFGITNCQNPHCFSRMFNKRLLFRALSSRVLLLLTILLSFAGGILVVFQALSLSQIIDRVFLGGQNRADVLPQLVILLVVFVLRAGLTWGAENSAHFTAIRVKRELRGELLEHLRALGPEYGRGEQTGELVNTVVEGVEALDVYFREYLPQLILAALVPLTILVFVFPIDWISGVILLVTAPLIPFFMMLIGSLAEALTRRQWQTLSRMSAYFLDVLQGITTLKILGRSRAQIKVIAQISENYRYSTMQVLRVAFLSALTLELLSTLSTALIAVGIGVRLLYGQLVFQDAFFLLLLAPDYYLPLRLLGTRFHAGIAGISSAERIFKILDIPTPQKTSLPNDLKQTLGKPPDLKLEQVSYFYPGETNPTLDKISIHIPAGTRVALVGPSGAGKSTLVALLLGFLQPTEGRILLNNQPVAALNDPDWQSCCAWVPQAPYLLNDTIAANLLLAKPEATQDEMETASRLAHAHLFIKEMDEAYLTMVGERGSRLSGGQAQRLALGRAFLRGAPFLVLDEATSNLDPTTEQKIEAAINQLSQSHTTITIAHRLPTIQSVDLVLVMNAGRVIQAGTPEELLQQEGLYRELVTAFVGNSETGSGKIDTEISQIPGTEELVETPSIAPEPSFVPKSSSSRQLVGLLIGFTKPLTGWVLLSTLLGFATVGSGIGLMTTSAYIIASAALQPSIATLQIAIVGVRFFGISRGVFRYLERLVTHQTTFRLLATLRVWFYTALEPLAPARLMMYRSGDLLSRISADINLLENFYVRTVAPPVVALFIAVMMGFFFAGYHPQLAVLFLGFYLASGVILPWIAQRFGQAVGKALVQNRAALNAALIDQIQGLAELLIYDPTQHRQSFVHQLSERTFHAQTRLTRINAGQNSVMLLLTNLCMWGVLFLGIPMVNIGWINGVDLAVLTLAALSAFEGVQPLPLAAATLDSSLQATRRLVELVDAQPLVTDPIAPVPAPTRYSLRVNQLTFVYPGSRHLALADLSFEVKQNEKVAIVGVSGAGKSTLINLLLRFWNCTPGSLFLGDIDLTTYRQQDIRQVMGVVSQRTHIFNASLRDNLLIAHPEASEAEIFQAIHAAQLDGLLPKLSDGLETILGDQGQRLSGGERQRLAIARVFLQNAPLLILDEATANLDALTEQALWQTLKLIMQGRTSLVITHRLVGLEEMDEIIVLHEGRITERGTQNTLLQQDGLYARMYALQRQVLDEKLTNKT
jgi:ATP-binding cassette, subfamily C, bacterial CydCD